jgi:hypothetical protein
MEGVRGRKMADRGQKGGKKRDHRNNRAKID